MLLGDLLILISLLTFDFNLVDCQKSSGPNNLQAYSSIQNYRLGIQFSPPSTPNGLISSYLLVISTDAPNPANCVIISLTCNNCYQTTGSGGTSINVPTGCGNVDREEKTFYNGNSVNILLNNVGIVYYKNYTVKAQAGNKWGWGDVSKTGPIMIEEYQACVISNFYCTNYEHLAITCNWLEKPADYVVGYNLTCDDIHYFIFNTNETRVNITSYIKDYSKYICKIKPISFLNCSMTVSYQVTIPMSPYGIPNQYTPEDFVKSMKNVSKTFKTFLDPLTMIGINLPKSYFGDRLSLIQKMSIVVGSSEANISMSGDLNFDGYVDKAYSNCLDGTDCVYEIEIPVKSKRSADSQHKYLDHYFIIGLTKEVCNLYCNGPLKENTKYQIGFRIYLSNKYGTAAVFLASTSKSPIPLIVGLICLFIFISIGVGLLVWKREYLKEKFSKQARNNDQTPDRDRSASTDNVLNSPSHSNLNYTENNDQTPDRDRSASTDYVLKSPSHSNLNYTDDTNKYDTIAKSPNPSTTKPIKTTVLNSPSHSNLNYTDDTNKYDTIAKSPNPSTTKPIKTTLPKPKTNKSIKATLPKPKTNKSIKETFKDEDEYEEFKKTCAGKD